MVPTIHKRMNRPRSHSPFGASLMVLYTTRSMQVSLSPHARPLSEAIPELARSKDGDSPKSPASAAAGPWQGACPQGGTRSVLT